MIGRVRIGLAALSLLVIGIVAWRSVPAPVRATATQTAALLCARFGWFGGKGCRYDTGITDQSPSIQVSRNGTLFIGRNAAGVLRSTDKGLTWQAITPPVHANGDSHAKGVHGTVHIDPVTDRVWYVTGNARRLAAR